MLGVFGIAAPQVATQPPHGWGAWVLLVAGAMAGGLFATGLLSSFFDPSPPPAPGPAPAGGLPPSSNWAWLRRLLLPIGVLGIAMAVGIGATMGIGTIRAALRGCTTPVEVPVVAGPETFQTATALARAFELATARTHRDCPAASLSVFTADPAEVQSALRDQWRMLDTSGPIPVDYLHDLGPRPQLWLPDSTVDVDRLMVTINRTGVRSPLGQAAIYSWTPVVLAAPPGGERLATPGDWLNLLQASSEAGIDVVRPDSSTSITGQLLLTATYPSAQVWTPADLKVARDVEGVLTSGRERAGYPLGDAAALLRQYQGSRCEAVPRIALILPEQFVLRPEFADRQLRADLGCPGGAATRRLSAIVPPDTPVVNHPVVPLLWTGADGDAAARTAADFVRWLGTEAGRQAIEATGRHAGDHRSAQVRSPARVTPGLDPALVDLIDQAVARHAEVARPVELLLAIDTSGSMATRFELGAAVLDGTADRLGDTDRLGLLSFGGGAAGAQLRVRPGPAGAEATADQPTRAAVRATLGRLRPAGGTPLLRGLDLGVSTLLKSPLKPTSKDSAEGAAPIRALVVVTDGRDTVGGPDAATVAERARSGGIQVFVVATGSVDCSLPVLATVTRRSDGVCLVARDGPEATADRLAAAIWGVVHD